MQRMLKPAHKQPEMGRQPGLEELRQAEKVLQLRLTGKRRSEVSHHSRIVTQHPSMEKKGKKQKLFLFLWKTFSENKSLS